MSSNRFFIEKVVNHLSSVCKTVSCSSNIKTTDKRLVSGKETSKSSEDKKEIIGYLSKKEVFIPKEKKKILVVDNYNDVLIEKEE